MKSYTAGTYAAKKTDVKQSWHLIDANGLVLGRLASEVAKILRGKHKAMFTPHANTGDQVVIINADKVAVTGKKLEQSIFYWHTGFPGGVKERTQGQILHGKYPERLLKKAVERMMPKESPLARMQMKNLYIYAGNEHPHMAQTPVLLDIASRNKKNKKRDG